MRQSSERGYLRDLRNVCLAAAVSAGLASLADAQTPSAKAPVYEIASVKESQPGNGDPYFEYLVGGRLSVRNWPLYWLITEAYGISYQSARLTGGFAWTHTEKFDVEAVAPPGTVPADLPLRARKAIMRPMLQRLLAERFHLEINHSARVVPVYEMTVAKGGIKLQRTTISGREPCRCFHGGPGRGLTGEAFEMADMVAIAEFWTDRPVIDKTGIQGEFDLPQSSAWTPIDRAQPGPALPTFFELYQSFGIKLKSRQDMVDLLSIVRVDRPSEN